MKLLSAPLLAALLCLAVLPAHGGALDEGLKAYERGQYRDAFLLWKPLAEQGDANAQFNLGLLYARGQGVKQDDGLALQWYHKAADQGLPEAQYNLGEMYFNGRGAFISRREAKLWWMRSAAKDYPPAQFNLGIVYLYGYGSAQDTRKGMRLVTSAAKAGYRPAQTALARIYAEGLFGIPASSEQSSYWQSQTSADQ